MRLQGQLATGSFTWSLAGTFGMLGHVTVVIIVWAAFSTFRLFSNLQQALGDLQEDQANMQQALQQVNSQLAQLLHSQTQQNLERLEDARLTGAAVEPESPISKQPPPELT